MKFLSWLLGLVIIVVVLVYMVAFTSFGNSLVQPIIEGKINEKTNLSTELKTFSLSMSDFEILLNIDKDNSLHVKGNYSLFSQAFNIIYKLNFEKLQNFKALVKAPVSGIFHTDGTIKGDMAFINIDGVSDVALSNTTYHVELRDLNPTSVIAKVTNADLVSLLKLGGQKPYASAKLDLDVNFKNIIPHALDGDIVLKTKKGKLNASLMSKDFKINIPHTAFTMNLDAKLKGDDIDYKYVLSSNLAKITSSGKVIPEPLNMDIKYNLNVDELAVLQPITGADVRGDLKLHGTLKGSKEKMFVKGKSDFARSDTNFEAVLKEFKPATLKASVKNLKLAKLLYMVKQPRYVNGLFSLNIDISDARSEKLKGEVTSNIKNGLINSKYITKTYKFKSAMPRTTFKLTTNTVLNGNIVDTKLNLISSLATFNIKKARVNLKDSSILSDYITTIPNLDKLYFATDRHLKGAISVNGELKKGKDLDLSIHTKIAGGTVDAKLHNDDFHAKLASIETLDALKMLIYPQMFKSSLNGVLDYNIAKAKGTFNGHLLDGKFTQNKMLDLVRKFGRVDMYVQRFKGDVTANINKEHILASLDLVSNSSSIKTKNTKLNSKTKYIDSKIDIVANNNPLTITLKGNSSSPKISIDAEKLIKREATKAIKKEATKVLQKEVGKLLKGFF